MIALFFGLLLIMVSAVMIIGGGALMINGIYAKLKGPGEDPYDYPTDYRRHL